MKGESRAQAGLSDDGLVELYLSGAGAVASAIAHPAVAERWSDASALPDMRIAGLVGHMARLVTLTAPTFGTIENDLPPPLTAAEYYVAGGDLTDTSSRSNTRVRETGEAAAAAGPGALALEVLRAVEDMRRSLPGLDLGVVHRMFGRSLTRRGILEARLVEMVVHLDDLEASVGIPADPPAEAVEVAIGVLLEMARLRHPPMAIVRALARRERDEAQALRVL